ncbi:ABC transporter ATP-binding protein [Plastoroseomonas hellenica]|uniref:ABC transporter ATP-binding protein n=1 Tax=Plastoroseomonas hellenica TaxID=2687306 RepID=A0ABS5F254_9PROT|nr:ABC transporter ATP-binding protein [Plastoroseomonas hellenica]MBR0647942.1 ABC transporter ATP-binding protein [Plastoroseomonas hellenica]MBR0666632.1 ABC transporter ATP-binding protein [Plastoroseomonas hellenica]
MTLISLQNVAIEFPLYHFGARSLKKRLLARLKTDDSNRIVVAALRDLNIEIRSGERVGLVGHNGAGKSTLLRTMAGIYAPVAGRLEVQGSIGSLIDPSAGIDPEGTGIENIRLHCLYRGLEREATDAFIEEVSAFSGLGEFLDVPVRGYSAGMSVRLSFAMATAMTPEVLLMDEWFLAGDADFMATAEARMTSLVGGAKILVLASHDHNILRRWCSRIIRLDRGRIVADGPVEDVLGPAAMPQAVA